MLSTVHQIDLLWAVQSRFFWFSPCTGGELNILFAPFQVLAVDGAPEPYSLTGTALVDIELTDVNDEAPKIEILIAQHGLGTPSMVQRQPQGGSQQELVAYIEESPSPDIVIAYVQVSRAYNTSLRKKTHPYL